MSRNFTMVSPEIWASPRFISLNSDGRLLMLYFVSGPHQSSSGCGRVKEGYALADLGWTSTQYRAARKAAQDAGLIDAEGDEVYVERWFFHCPPTNTKHGLGIKLSIGKIASDRLRKKAEIDFAATEWVAKFSMRTSLSRSNLAD